MDVPRECVAKRTRYQCQKAQEQLLEKAKTLKDEKDKVGKRVKSRLRTPIQKRRSKDSSREGSSSDIEILGEEYVPLDQRRELLKSRNSKRHQNIVIEQTLVSSPRHDSKDANQNWGTCKEIGAPSRSNSASTSSKDNLRYYEGDDLVLSVTESNDNHYNGDENQNQGRQLEIGNSSVFCWESSGEGDCSESDNNDTQGGENENQGRNVEIDDPSMVSISESSSEEDGGESDDTDYKGGESVNSESESDDLSYYHEDNLEGGADKGDDWTSSVKPNPVEEKVDYKEHEGGVRKRTNNEREDGEESGKKRKVLGLDIWVDDTKKDDGVIRSRLERLQPCQVSESRKKKIDSGEPSSNASNQSDDKNEREDGDCRSTLKEMDPVTKKRKAGNVHEKSGKKKKVLGLDIWVDDTKRDDRVMRSRLERLRPRQVSESRKKKLDTGKPSCPIRIIESDESDDASDVDHFVRQSSRRSRVVVGKQSKRKNCKAKDTDFMNILADSIWEKGDALKEKLPPLKEKDPNENALPLKFRFEDEDPASVEKDEVQKELDNLFSDLEMGWTEDDIGSTKLSKEENDDAAAKVTDPVERCRLGCHFLILNEQIGVICKYCGAVQQEMKHILPDLKIPTCRRQEWFDSDNDECSISYGFDFGDSGSGDHQPFIDSEGPVLNLIPAALRRRMYPHQLDGFQFLWKNIAGATLIENMRTPLSEDGTGCIISHAPGTGKSYLTIVFLLTFMKVHPTCRPVIIAPLTMLGAWANELKMWKIKIPFHNLNDPELSGEENAMATCIIKQVGSSRRDKKRDRDYKRMVKLYSWTKNRSILGIGYNLFSKLVDEHKKGDHAENFRKILIELPSILILDEGHTPRNHNSLLWKALTKVKTGRRIILSGTPFQNNFDELYNTFCLVNPKFAENISVKTCKGGAKRNSNLAKGRWDSLTNLIDRNTDDAIEELRAMMDPFVHVRKGNILQESLPGLKDTLVVLNPTDLQKKLIREIPGNVLEKVHLLSLVSVHPSLVAQYKEFSDQRSILEKLEMTLEAGVKTQFVIEVVRLSVPRGEKVLIFSEFIDPLNFLMKQLTSYFSWEEGKQVLYMDGKLDGKQRHVVINSLNADNSEVKVLLASTKACCEGINLVGASRVVLLDVVWNPSVERQAISRAYRLGQKKFVYVYHLIMSGTMEVEKYQRQAKKDRISELVFSSPANGHHSKSEISGIVSGDKILEAMVGHKKLRHIFENILHQPKESNVFENFNFVSSAK